MGFQGLRDWPDEQVYLPGAAGAVRAGCSEVRSIWMGSELPSHNLQLLWLGQRPEEGSLVHQQKPRREITPGALKPVIR